MMVFPKALIGEGPSKTRTSRNRSLTILEAVWRDAALSIAPDLFSSATNLERIFCGENRLGDLMHGRRLKERRNLLQYEKHAHSGIDGSIHLVMMRSGVHHQDFGSLVSLLDHVGQVMTVIL